MANITLQEMFDKWEQTANGIGTPSDSAQPDPTQAATIIAALKGQLERLGDLLEQMQGNGTGAMPVQLTGSIVELATISTPTIVTAGSSLTVLPRASRFEYKSLRGVMRLQETGTAKMQIQPKIGDTSTASAPALEIATINGGVNAGGSADVYSEWFDVAILNNGSTDVTVRYAQVLGVR